MRNAVAVILLSALFIAVPAAVLWYRDHLKCRERQKTVDAREAQLRTDAKKLPVGASRQDVEAFYKANGITPQFSTWNGKNSASGRVEMKACSEHWYCGDDVGIFVDFKLDNNWRVVSSDVGVGWLSCL